MSIDLNPVVVALGLYLLAGFCVAVTLTASLGAWNLRLQERAEALWPSMPAHKPGRVSYLKTVPLWPLTLFFTVALVWSVRAEERRRASLPFIPPGGIFSGGSVGTAGGAVSALDAFAKASLLTEAQQKVVDVFRLGNAREERELVLGVAHAFERALGLETLPVPTADERGLFGAIFTFRADCDGEHYHVALSLTLHRALTVSSRLVYDVEPYVVATFGFMGGDGVQAHLSFDVDAGEDGGGHEYAESDDTGVVSEVQEAVALALLGAALDGGSGYAVDFSVASVRFIVRAGEGLQVTAA